MNAKKWILNGEIDPNNITQEQILEQCGVILDKHCSEILVFEGTDGKYYTITVEAVIAEANPKYVKDRLKED